MLDKQRVLDILCEELKQRPVLQYACKKADISRSHLYRWMKEDQEFAAKIEAAKQEGTDVVNDFSVSKLLNGINNDNIAAVFFWLRHRHPDFASKLEVTSKQEVAYTLTEEQKSVIQEALKLSGLTESERSELEQELHTNDHEQTPDRPAST